MVHAPTPEMKEYRAQIDQLDIEIARLLGVRFDIIRKVADHKKQQGIPAVLPDRIDEVIAHARKLGENNQVDADLMETLYRAIVKHACEFESTVIEP